MKLEGNTILITGGGSGIGLALAREFVGLGNEVIICGRRLGKLEEAKREVPSLIITRCDISKSDERKNLLQWIESNHGSTNILVNNAGVQRNLNLAKGEEDFKRNNDEIDINLIAQIELSALFIPFLSSKKEAAIINVTSGLGLIPLAKYPIYSATKAAMHSYTLSLRHQLKSTSIGIIEVIPPTVYDTELKGERMKKTEWSISSSEMAKAIIKGLKEGKETITAGTADYWNKASNEERVRIFQEINK